MGKNNNIQMDFSKRNIIKNCLIERKTATEISEILKVHKSTISREIKNYRYLSFKGDDKPSLCSNCQRNKTCVFHHRCGRSLCNSKCMGCKSLQICDKYVEIKCNIENRYPFVCNNCKFDKICSRNHYLYDPKKADEAAQALRKESRQGINLSNEEYHFLNKTLKDGVEKGQSIYHILKSTDIGKTLKTIYNYVNNGQLSIKPIDLPRAVTLKKRKSKIPNKYEYKENRNIDRKHRMYCDWLVYQSKNRIIVYWQMDFLGAPKKSEQQILTLVIPQFEFVYLIPLKYPDSQKMTELFDSLEAMLGDDFSKVFEAILTDRDCKFNDFNSIEINDMGVVRTRVFFCDPTASNEKPSVENFNEQIRRIFKKGVLLSNITFDQCNVISSHLNSRFLNSIDGKRPCDLFIEYFGIEIFKKLNLQIINPKDVQILTFKKY
ncbi:MAG: IS30 family transposase [Alphaproteobacteria bacterium]|nr:IS30 family transposase [Alphaproteobacteria bacterium]